jgi:hypothetical protein
MEVELPSYQSCRIHLAKDDGTAWKQREIQTDFSGKSLAFPWNGM